MCFLGVLYLYALGAKTSFNLSILSQNRLRVPLLGTTDSANERLENFTIRIYQGMNVSKQPSGADEEINEMIKDLWADDEPIREKCFTFTCDVIPNLGAKSLIANISRQRKAYGDRIVLLCQARRTLFRLPKSDPNAAVCTLMMARGLYLGSASHL